MATRARPKVNISVDGKPSTKKKHQKGAKPKKKTHVRSATPTFSKSRTGSTTKSRHYRSRTPHEPYKSLTPKGTTTKPKYPNKLKKIQTQGRAKTKGKAKTKTKTKTKAKTPRDLSPSPHKKRKKSANLGTKLSQSRRANRVHLNTNRSKKPRSSTPNIARKKTKSTKSTSSKSPVAGGIDDAMYLAAKQESYSKRRSKSSDMRRLNTTKESKKKDTLPLTPSLKYSKSTDFGNKKLPQSTPKLNNQSRSSSIRAYKSPTLTIHVPDANRPLPPKNPPPGRPKKTTGKVASRTAQYNALTPKNTRTSLKFMKPKPHHAKSNSLCVKKSKSKRSKVKKKRKSVQMMVYQAQSPVSPHPTIGEFYSRRVRKRKLLRRQLPSKPEDVSIYFILLGKMYPNTIKICLDCKLTQILSKLSAMLVLNEEILSVIHRQLGQKKKKLSNANGNESYDLIVNNPIFIYKNNAYQGSETFDSIGFKQDFDVNEQQYIVILSCTGQTKRGYIIEPKKKNGHFRSRTQDDRASHNGLPRTPKLSMPVSPSFSGFGSFGSLTNIANAVTRTQSADLFTLPAVRAVNESRFKDLRKCCVTLGFKMQGIVDMLDLIDFVHETISDMDKNIGETQALTDAMEALNLSATDTKKSNHTRGRKRGRSRSWAGGEMKILVEGLSTKPEQFEIQAKAHDKSKLNPTKSGHHRYNHSVPDMEVEAKKLQLDLSSMRSQTMDLTEHGAPTHKKKLSGGSRFSRLFKRQFSKKKSPKNSLKSLNASLSPASPVIISESSSDIYMNMSIEAALDDQKATQQTVNVTHFQNGNAKVTNHYIEKEKQKEIVTVTEEPVKEKKKEKKSFTVLDQPHIDKEKEIETVKEETVKEKRKEKEIETVKPKKKEKKQKEERERKSFTIRDKHGKVKTVTRGNGSASKTKATKSKKATKSTKSTQSTVTITRRTNKPKAINPWNPADIKRNNNKIRAKLIVEGYINTATGSGTSGKDWRKLYFTLDKGKLLSWYNTKNSDLTSPIGALPLNRGECSFNVDSQGTEATSRQIITVTVKHPDKNVIRHFKGTTASLEKWKRAFLF